MCTGSRDTDGPCRDSGRATDQPLRHEPLGARQVLFPHGSKVNDRIDRGLCSLSYVSVEDVASTILRLERGTLMVKTKVDIKSAYRLILVHPEDRPFRHRVAGPDIRRHNLTIYVALYP